MKFKKLYLFIILIFITNNIFSFEDFKFIKYKQELSYYGFPLKIKEGITFQKDWFNLYANVGLSFENEDDYKLNAFTGIDFNFNILKISSYFNYNLLNISFDKDFFNEEYCVKNNLLIPFYKGSADFIFDIGNKKLKTKDETFYRKYFTSGINGKFYLFDTGSVKSDFQSLYKINSLYEEDFIYGSLKNDLLFTYYLKYFDISFCASSLNIFEYKENKNNYIIEKSYSSLTGRLSFSDKNQKYNSIYSIENESRYFPLRHKYYFSNFFISSFANIGIGLYEETFDFLYQAGCGIGYKIFDCVPFTVQIGIDNNLKPILYINVVSRLSHLL